MGFRENVKFELAYSGMLVKELSAKSGVSKYSLDNYLNAKGQIPSADVAVKIAQALGVTVEYLVTGEERATDKSSLDPVIHDVIQSFKSLKEEDRKLTVDFLKLLKGRANVRK